MERTQVTSSSIKSIGWEAGELEVEFVSGSTYRYHDVPRQVYEDLMAADSKGHYLQANVKGQYAYTKLNGSGW